MALVQRKVVIAGAHKGKDITLAGVEFKNGEAVLAGPERDVDGLYTYLHRCWQVEYAEGAAPQEPAPAEPPKIPETPPQSNERLAKAVMSLDPNNDEHWTQTGKPAMSAIEMAYGSSGITRAQVEAAAPGFTREVASQQA